MAAHGRVSHPLEDTEPWVADQVRRRLANFLHLFPGHTAVNVHDIAYGDWEALAAATDRHIADMKAAQARSRR